MAPQCPTWGLALRTGASYGWGTTSQASRYNFGGLLRVCMALKTLWCCGDSSLPGQRSALRAIYTLNPPKSASLEGCKLSIQSVGKERKASCGVLGGHFRQRRPWLWWLWCQLCFVIRLLQIAIKIIKLVFWIQFLYVLLHIVKHIAVHVLLIVAWLEPKLCSMASLNHFSPIEPWHIGYHQKALVIARMISRFYQGQNIGINEKWRKGWQRCTYTC
jgi:hypothetical protein